MVRTRRRRLAALLLAMCMALGLLAGCGDKGGNTQQLSATVYVPQYLDLGVKLDDLSGCCVDEENFYLIGQTAEQTEHADSETGETYYEVNYTYDLYRAPLAGGAAEKLPNYEAPFVPEGYEGNAYIESISPGGDGTLWVTENVYIWGPSNGENFGGGIAVDDIMPRAMTKSAGAVAIPADEPAGDVDDSFEPTDTTIRRQISADGTELKRIELSGLQEKLGLDYVGGITFGDEGIIYVTVDEQIMVLDGDLNTLFTLDMPKDTWSQVTYLGGGKACITNWSYDETTETSCYKVTMIDMENQKWGTEYLLPSSAYNIYPGGGEYLFYYQINDAIFGWKENAPEGETAGERLFSWIEADISVDSIQSFFFLSDGRVAAVTREWKSGGQSGKGDERYLDVGAVILTATPRSQLPEKTALIYATMSLSYEDRARIIDFNKTSDKYRIEVKDYAQYNTATDDSAGLQKLNTEIIAGVVPDILCTSGIPLKQYAAKGVLEDLWPFIDNDPDLGRDKLMVRPLEADQMDGKLYEVFNTFNIRTVIGAKDVVGDRMSWTLADLNAALAAMPEGCTIFGEDDTKDGMLSTILSMNMENFVDWDTGKCSFDSENFKSLLAFCNTFAAEFDYENVDWEEWEDSDSRIYNGRQMLSQAYLSSFDWSVQRYSALFPNGMSYIGFPMEDGSVGSSFGLSTGYAISTTCQDKDGAWSFVRQVLLPTEEDNRYYSGFPVNKADFESGMKRAMEVRYVLDENGEPYLDENGEKVIENQGSLWISDGIELEMKIPTQEDMDQLMELYNAVTSISRYDDSIYDIVSDVAGGYFAGDKSLDETASLIQNRVSLYVNESK